MLCLCIICCLSVCVLESSVCLSNASMCWLVLLCKIQGQDHGQPPLNQYVRSNAITSVLLVVAVCVSVVTYTHMEISPSFIITCDTCKKSWFVGILINAFFFFINKLQQSYVECDFFNSSVANRQSWASALSIYFISNLVYLCTFILFMRLYIQGNIVRQMAVHFLCTCILILIYKNHILTGPGIQNMPNKKFKLLLLLPNINNIQVEFSYFVYFFFFKIKSMKPI